jgi:ssDNA-binding Zn-finger/Zn-ribbon topoisomerase 1
MTQAWLVLAVGEDRQHGGNAGYDDVPDAHYSWDSTVANHSRLRAGDLIVLWDKTSLVGASVIESISVGDALKIVYRCPRCRKASIKQRKKRSPRYKCNGCGEEFNEPLSRKKQVTTYQSRHDAGWVAMDGLMAGSELRGLCVSPKSQQSLRPFRWEEFRRSLDSKGFAADLEAPTRRTTGDSGHRKATVRVRVGQAEFRRRLLKHCGDICAMCGPTPPQVLEACHLYSYADLGEHYDHGGLLMRRDIHRLFDNGDVAIDPTTQTIDVRSSMHSYQAYQVLHGKVIHVSLQLAHKKWLQLHWAQHRSS